jgi:prefoldin subunit 5
MIEKAQEKLDTLRRQHSQLMRDMDGMQAQLAQLQGRMNECGQLITAVSGGIVALEQLVAECAPAPATQPVEEAAAG